MGSTGLLQVEPDWVTLRADTTSDTGESRPVVVLVDRAIVTTAPYEVFTLQVAVAVPLGETRDGLPAETDKEGLRQLEQHLVDAAAGEARLVAVMSHDGVREWILYARTTAWAKPFLEAGISVMVGEDPTFQGLLELAGSAG